MKKTRLYNVIFPIWLVMFMPPVLLIMLAGNWIIDSIVLLILYKALKLGQEGRSLKEFYLHSVWRTWLGGFMADLGGAAVAFASCVIPGMPQKVPQSLMMNPFGHVLSALIMLLAIALAGGLIYLLNFNWTFKGIQNIKTRRKAAIITAICTAPWTFLLPTQWFLS